MSTTKENMDVAQVIIQEGVPTIQMHDGKTAESMVYLVAGEPVDSFLRVNDQKSALENLNSSGMSFAINANKSELVNIVAKLAAIAACNES
jgi:glutamate--cysteine ligase